MSITADVFIKFKGSRKKLLQILDKDFRIVLDSDTNWFLGFMEMDVFGRTEKEPCFRPYDFVLESEDHAWSSAFGTASDGHLVVMDMLAQTLAAKLKTRTMLFSDELGVQRRYRYVRPMRRNKGCMVLDESTGKPPELE